MPHIEIHGYSEVELRKVEASINAFIDDQKGTIGGEKITSEVCKKETHCKHEKNEVFLRVYLEWLLYDNCFNYLMGKLEALKLEIQLIKFAKIPPQV